MNKYRITNTETGEVVEGEAEYLGTAIKEIGWPVELCSCEIVWQEVDGQRIKPEKGGQKRVRVRKPVKEVVAKVPEVAIVPVAPVESIVSEPTEGEKTALEHKRLIESMALEAEVMFLRMGQLLYNAREQGEWTMLRYESYREYVEDLKLPVTNSYSWATRLSSIFEYLVKNMGLDEKLLAEIGVAKLTRLLPLARKGELTDEVIQAARVLSDLDLRASLGHSVGGGDTEDMIICPRCGEQFDAKKATRV